MTLVKLAAVVAAALGAVLILGTAPSHHAEAQSQVTAGIDTDTSGNTATSVGDVQSCKQVHQGDTFQVDVFVKGIPPVASGGAGGIAGFGYNFFFDPKVVEVTAVDDKFLLSSGANPAIFEIIDADATAGTNNDPLPATTGNLRVDYADLGPSVESGDGVLSRLTLKALAGGGTTLKLGAVQLLDAKANPYDGTLENAALGVDQSCSAPPPMQISAAATPEPGSSGGGAQQSPGASGGPGATNAPGASGAATPSTGRPSTPPGSGSAAKHSPSPSPSSANGSDSGGSGPSTGLWIAIGVAVAAAVGGAGYLGWLRFVRRPSP